MADLRVVQFVVHGTPKPKGSARGFVAMKAGKARAIVTTDNKGLKSWETAVRFAAQSQAGELLMMGAVEVEIDFYLQRPPSVSEKKRPFMTTKPDLSKLVRGFEDALNEVVWKDDSQVVRITATKNYATVGDGSRAVVTIKEHRAVPASLPRSPELFEGIENTHV